MIEKTRKSKQYGVEKLVWECVRKSCVLRNLGRVKLNKVYEVKVEKIFYLVM